MNSAKRVLCLKLCRRCALAETRANVVYGRGSMPAEVLFIGEAPSRTEDLLGEPFVGPTGRLLSMMLYDVARAFGKEFSYYITNTIFCRPCDDKQAESRQPSPEEVFNCRSNVEFIVKTVQPKLLVLLGKIPEHYCADLHQQCVALHHPTFLLRQGGPSSPFYLPNKNKLLSKLKEVL